MSSKDSYNSVELSLDEVQDLGLHVPDPDMYKGEPVQDSKPVELVEENTEGEASQNDISEESGNDEVDEYLGPDDYEIVVESPDGWEEVYGIEDILDWRKDAVNKNKWQQSNTQKSQDLSKHRTLLNNLKDNKELREHLEDFFYDNPEELDKLGLSSLDDIDLPEEVKEELIKENPEIEEVKHQLEEMRMDQAINSVKNEFAEFSKSKDNLGDDKVATEFLTFMGDKGFTDFEDAYKIYFFDDLKTKAVDHAMKEKNSKRMGDRVVTKGGKGVATKKVPNTKMTSYKDIKADDADISSYLDNLYDS